MIEFNELVTECVFYMIVFASVIFGSKLTYLSSPFALCAIIPGPLFVFLIAILFGQLNAVFFSIMISLAVLNASSYQLVPFLFVLASSFASSRLVRKIDRRTDMVFVSVLQAVLNAVFIIIFKIIFNGSFANGLGSIVGVILNGFFSGILCLGLLTPLELLLNTASVFRLMDLSDLNNPVMKKMLVTASGTYNHSLMVASLAEAACNEVGANPLLARADCDCVDCKIPPLLLGEIDFTHPVHYGHLLLHLLNGGGDCTAEFLEAVVDVADRNALEFLRGDYETVGAYEAEDTHHELEGIESVMGVGEDNLRIGVNLLTLLGLLRDIHLRVLKRYEVERADI